MVALETGCYGDINAQRMAWGLMVMDGLRSGSVAPLSVVKGLVEPLSH